MRTGPLRTRRTGTRRPRRPGRAVLLVGAVGLVVALPSHGPAPAARILHPPDGAVLGSPVPVVLAADGVTLRPCDVPAPCEGHLTVVVDRPCLPAGELVPSGALRADELGVHGLTDGGRVALLHLALGTHTLCAQLADGARLAFGATQTVTVTVDRLVADPSRSVVATVPPDVGATDVVGSRDPRSAPWPVSSSATASRTSP